MERARQCVRRTPFCCSVVRKAQRASKMHLCVCVCVLGRITHTRTCVKRTKPDSLSRANSRAQTSVAHPTHNVQVKHKRNIVYVCSTLTFYIGDIYTRRTHSKMRDERVCMDALSDAFGARRIIIFLIHYYYSPKRWCKGLIFFRTKCCISLLLQINPQNY